MKLLEQESMLMTEGRIIPLIIRFSVPLLIGNLLQQSYQLVDLIIVGRCIKDGGLSIAAVGMGTSFINMMIGFFLGLSTGAGIVISNAYGAKRLGRVRHSIYLAIKLAACVAVTVSIFSVLTCDWFLTVTNTTEEIFHLSGVYLKIYYIGFIPLLIYNMGTSILQALGNSVSPFYYLTITCVLNIFLDIVFLQYFGMGVGGAAAATVVSQVIAMILVLRKILRPGFLSEETEAEGNIVEKGESRRILGTMIRYSLPIALQQLTVSGSNLILQGYVNLLGTQIIAAFGIFSKIDGFLLLPLSSFSVAITTFTGQNYGAGNLSRILQAKRYVSRMSAGVTLGLSAILILLCEPIVRFFEDSPQIIEATKEMCVYMLPFYFLLALSRVYAGLFNGLGKPAYGSVTLIACLCIARVAYITVAFPFVPTILSIYISYYISWVLCFLMMAIAYRVFIRKMLYQEERISS